MVSRGKWAPFGVIGLVSLLGLGTGTMIHTASGSPGGVVRLTVPGAMNLSVHCGGTVTHFADGDHIEFSPEGPSCDLEAPLSPVMPVRGELVLGRSLDYECTRHAMELICEAL